MSRILIPEYLLDFARDIYEYPLPSNFGERLIDRKDVQVLENWYKVFGGKIPSNQGKRMVPRYLLLFIQNLANAEILEVVDDDIAYIKETPQNALKYAFIEMLGGMSYRVLDEITQEYIIQNSPVTSVNDFVIPDEIQDLEGYGWGVNENTYNYIDFNRKVFVKKVDRIDMGTLTNWTAESDNVFYANVSNAKGYFATNGTTQLCSKYANTNVIDLSDKTCKFGNSSTNINIHDNSFIGYTSAQIQSALSGVYLYYELATPIEIDISEYLGENIIDVSNNITFNNEHEQAVPSEITYYVRS